MAASEFSLDNGILILQGEVTFATVTALEQQLNTLLTTEVRQLDCSAVARVDSSIMALLLSALGLAKTRNIALTILPLPDAVATLSRLYGLDELFPSHSPASQ